MINSTHTTTKKKKKKMDHHDTNHADGLGRQLPQDLKFCLLADKPHLSPSLAQWFYHEWPETYHDFDINSVADTEKDLQRYLNRDKIPICLIAYTDDGSGEEIFGTVSLDVEDLLTHKHIDKWLVCVYVPEKHRKKGVVSVLLHEIARRAKGMGIREVHLWCEERLSGMYAHHGWVIKERLVYLDHPITILKLDLTQQQQQQ